MKTYADAVRNPSPSLEHFYPETRTWSMVPPAFDSSEILKSVNSKSLVGLAGKEITQLNLSLPPSPVGVLGPFEEFLTALGLGFSNVKVYFLSSESLYRQKFPSLTKERQINRCK